jgi:GT2 family glycosyltransferase
MTASPRPMLLPITLCIVNYNGARYLNDALQAASNSSGGFSEILLVDNASTDASLELVRTHFPQVRVLALSENTGPAGARNAGYGAASGALILFQDNDVRLQPECAATLYSRLQTTPGALLVAPRVLYERDPAMIQYDSADCHFLGLMAPRNADRLAAEIDSGCAATTSLVTACFLIDRRRWPDSQLFDEDFVFNLEDHDFGVRANLRGLETWVEPCATVRHGDGTADLSYRPGRAVVERRMYYLIRNRWLIIGKSYALRTLLVLSPVLLSYEVLQLAGLIRKGWFGVWWKAIRSFLSQLPELRRKRAAVQATRRISDRAMLRGGPLPLTAAFRRGRIERSAIAVFGRFANGYWKLMRNCI